MWPQTSTIEPLPLTDQPGPTLLDNGPWWQALDPSFYRFPERFKLNALEQLLVSLTAASDVGLRTLAATLVGSLALPLGYHPLKAKHLFTERQFYESKADTGDPRHFFRRPPPNVEVQRSRPSWPYYQIPDGTCEVLQFKSPFEPVNPRFRKEYKRNKRNSIAYARYWRHKKGPRPTICVIHGFFADPYWLNEWFFALPWFYKLGCDVMLFTLPFHGPRQGCLSPFSGHGFFAGGIIRLNEAFAHAVYDFRIFREYLRRERGVEQLGVTGISLGGYTSALLAGVEEGLAFAIPNVPLVSIGDLILEWFPISTVVKTLLKSFKISIRDIRHMLAVHTPLTYKPLIDRERLMIIGGAGDRLAPPKHAYLLWEHWNRCRIHWFKGNHVIHLDQAAYLKAIARFLGSIGFLPTRRKPK